VARFHALKGKALVFLLFIWSLWFMNFMARAILSPVLPLIEDEFGVLHARATSIFLFIGMGYAFSVFFSGVYARILGPKKSVCMSLTILGLTFLAISLVRTFDLFYPIGIVLGLATGMYLPAAIPLLTDYYDQGQWGKVISIHDSGAALSMSATPFIAVILLLFLPWRGMLVVIAIIYFLVAIVFYAVTEDVRVGTKITYFPGHVLKAKAIWYLGVIWIFMAGATMGLYFVVPLYLAKELSLTIEHANTVFGVSRIGAAVVGITAGFLVDRFRAKRILFFLVLTTGIFTALVAVRDLRWIKVFLFLQATVAAGFPPISLVAISKMFERETRGQAVGLIVTLGVIGTAVIPYFLGLSGDLVSFRLGFLLLGIVTVLSSGLLCFVKELE
jgi:NNP family nitrate/nitrite transporter-like MFS transporter